MSHYLTTSMSETAFLMTLGHQPIKVRGTPNSSIRIFAFPGHCGELAQAFYRDAEVSSRRYQLCYQEVRHMIRDASRPPA
jgi:hypothetical protein